MSDIVSRAKDRPYLHDNDDAAVWSMLIDEMADEIERLQKANETMFWKAKKMVLDDMREWGGVETPNGWMAGFDHRMLDAYEKDRLK